MSNLQLLDRDNQKPSFALTVEGLPEGGGWLANLTIQAAQITSAEVSVRAGSRGVIQPSRGRRATELEWRRTHAQALSRYRGQWVALEGDRIISYGPRLAEVVQQARASGVRVPYVFRVEDLPEGAATIGL